MIYALLIIVAIIAVATYFLTRKSPLERRARKAVRLTENVWVEQGEPYPNVGSVDDMLRTFLDEAEAKGYHINQEVNIAFLKPDGVSETGIPVFIIKSGKYSDTEYSSNGRMKIGGQFFPPDLIILPSQRNDDEMREVLRHELVHFAHWIGDKAKYERFKVHKDGEVFDL